MKFVFNIYCKLFKIFYLTIIVLLDYNVSSKSKIISFGVKSSRELNSIVYKKSFSRVKRFVENGKSRSN